MRRPWNPGINSSTTAGEEWAKDDAGAHHLMRLADAREKAVSDSDWKLCFGVGPGVFCKYDSGERFFFIIDPPERDDRCADAEQFWSYYALDDDTSLAHDKEGTYVLAFAEGALSVWNEVKDQV